MESSVQFQELEQYAKQHTRFSAPADSDLDFNEQYVQALHEHGYTEDDWTKDQLAELIIPY